MTDPGQDRIALVLGEALAGSYRLERELARGAASRIYVASDLRHDRIVAVKVVSPELASSDSAERFLHEIRVTAGLQHPNILPLLDSGASSGILWYVMPLVEGMSLRQRLAEGPLPVREVIRITIDVALALEYAHRSGVIHRDIKPGNVLFSAGRPVVADFGFAHLVGTTAPGRVPDAEAALGTPAYLSPEQATGGVEVDYRTDYYALGCMLYEMLTGRPPFVGTVTEVIRHHAETPPQPPSALSEEVSPALDRIVLRLLEKSPKARYQTVKDLVQDLETVIAQETLEGAMAGSEPVEIAIAHPGRRRLWLFLLAPALLAVVTIVLVFGSRDDDGLAPSAIAALPLEVPEGDAAARAMADGFADELATELTTRLGSQVEVRSALSAAALASRGLTAKHIGDSLGVVYLFEGEVERESGLRVTLRLIDTRRDAVAWARTWELNVAEASAQRGAIVAAAVAAIDSLLTAR